MRIIKHYVDLKTHTTLNMEGYVYRNGNNHTKTEFFQSSQIIDTPNYPLCRLELMVETFGHST